MITEIKIPNKKKRKKRRTIKGRSEIRGSAAWGRENGRQLMGNVMGVGDGR